MPSDGSRTPAQTELDRTLEELVARQKGIDKRVERLETLEFDQVSIGQGCVTWVDYDLQWGAGKATFRVDMPPILASGMYPYSQATIWWAFSSKNESNTANLLMQVDGNVGANYSYAYKYSKAGALNQGNADAATSFFVGRIAGNTSNRAMGKIDVPFAREPSAGFYPCPQGSWTMHDTAASANQRQEKGEWGGTFTFAAVHATRFDFFASAGNLFGEVYLYAWCPDTNPGVGPDD